MTNEQLKILLENYRRQLDEGIDQAIENIPDLEVEYTNAFGFTGRTYPAIKGIISVLHALQADIEALEGLISRRRQ